MYGPKVSGKLISYILCSVQRILQKNKIEGSADPCNAESEVHHSYNYIQPFHQMPFIYSSLHHKVNTDNDSDDGKDDGGVYPILYAMCLFLLFFVPCISFDDGMHPVSHDDEHDKDGDG